jgi:hypothetical protein
VRPSNDIAHQLQAIMPAPHNTHASYEAPPEGAARTESAPLPPVGCMRGLGSSARRALTDSRYSHLAAWRMTMAVVTPRMEMAFRGGEQCHAPEDLSAH